MNLISVLTSKLETHVTLWVWLNYGKSSNGIVISLEAIRLSTYQSNIYIFSFNYLSFYRFAIATEFNIIIIIS